MTKIAVDPHLDLVGESPADAAAAASTRSAPQAASDRQSAAADPASGPALSELVVLVCTFPTAEAIGEIGLTLVGEGLCACVNILHEALSIYRWNDEIVTNKEVLCLIKTTRARHAELVERLTELHPYEVPEIITLGTSAVNQPYLQWVNSVTDDDARLAMARGDEEDENR